MTECKEQDDAVELVDRVTVDPLRQAFGAALSALIDALGEGPVCDCAMRELVAAEQRVRERLARRIFH